MNKNYFLKEKMVTDPQGYKEDPHALASRASGPRRRQPCRWTLCSQLYLQSLGTQGLEAQGTKVTAGRPPTPTMPLPRHRPLCPLPFSTFCTHIHCLHLIYKIFILHGFTPFIFFLSVLWESTYQ